jgi:hypothetical protein
VGARKNEFPEIFMAKENWKMRKFSVYLERFLEVFSIFPLPSLKRSCINDSQTTVDLVSELS